MLLGVYALSSSFLSKQHNILQSIDDTKFLICHILLYEFGPQGGYPIRKASLIFGGRIPHLGLGWAYRPPPPAQVRISPLLRNGLPRLHLQTKYSQQKNKLQIRKRLHPPL